MGHKQAKFAADAEPKQVKFAADAEPKDLAPHRPIDPQRQSSLSELSKARQESGKSEQERMFKKRASRMIPGEAALVQSAQATFDGEQEGTHFTFANRAHWAHFKALLKSTATDTDEDVSGPCVLHELETETDRALRSYEDIIQNILETFERRGEEPTQEAFLEDMYVSSALQGGVVFVGHVCTDLDSVAGAVGAAQLFGGIAARSELELNGEIMYALEEVAKMPMPPLFDDIPGGAKPGADGKFKKVCLVDHNEVKQMHPALAKDKKRSERIVGLIDHHAFAESFFTNGPLFVDVRPWGSMSSIVAHMYLRNNVKMDKAVARLLMCAILSDTLNLQSVTTTDADRFAVALLAKRGGVKDPDEVARLMFRAKTKWIVNMGSYAMVRGDQKDFSCDGWKFGISVLEVTTMEPVLQVADELILELRALKVEKGNGKLENELDFAFLFIVDVLKGCSVLLVCGGREYSLASKAFPGCPTGKAHPNLPAPGRTITADQTLMDVGPLVSRKAQFVPAFLQVLGSSFECHKERVTSDKYVDNVAVRAGVEEAKPTMNDDQSISRAKMETLSVAVFGRRVSLIGGNQAA